MALSFTVTRRWPRRRQNATKLSLPLNCCRPSHIRRIRNSSSGNGVVHYSCVPTVPALTIFLVGQPRQSHRTEWSAQCHLHRIVPTQRYTPAQVLSRGAIALGKFRGRAHLPSETFRRRWSPTVSTRLPTAPQPQRTSRLALCKTARPRAGTVGSPPWPGWSHLRVIGAESSGRIPVVCIPTTSPVPAWNARWGGSEIGPPMAPYRSYLYRHARSAVMSISIQPWHGPLKMSVCITPASVPFASGV
jgi:hypothetical protein